MLGWSASVQGAPLYRAGKTHSLAQSWLHGEISAGYVFSSHQMQNFTQEDVTSRLRGGEVRALWAPTSWLAAGIELTRFKNEDLLPVLQKYQVQQVAALFKLSLSPDTNPRFYVLAGVGKSKHKLEYNRNFLPVHNYASIDKSIPFGLTGLGVEIDVWKAVFIGLEGTLTYYKKVKLSNYYELSSHVETALHLRTGVKF